MLGFSHPGSPVGTLSIDGTAGVYGATITLRGADENIASTATVGSAAPAVKVLDGGGINDDRNSALAVDAAGNLFVANYDTNTISEVTPAGSVSTFVSSGLDGPEALAFDAAGNLYVANDGNGTISEVTPSRSISTFASGLSFPGPGRAFSMALDGAGNLYVGNGGNISKVTPSGSVSTFVSRPASSVLAVDAAGNLYVGNSNGNGSISKVTPSGIASPFASTGLHISPYALAFDAGNLLAIGEDTFTGNQTIQEVTPSGSVSTIGNAGLDQFFGDSFAVDAAGNIYVPSGSAILELTPPLAPTTQLTIQSSVESRPMSIGGTNDAAVDGINLTNAELARLVVGSTDTSAGTITFGDSAQTGNITFSTAALPSGAAGPNIVALESPSAGGQIVLDDGSGSGPALDAGNVAFGITLTAGTGGIVEAATNTAGTADINDENSYVALSSAGAIGSASQPLQVNATGLNTVSATGTTVGGATAVNYFSAYNTTSGDISLTNGSPGDPTPLEIDGISEAGTGQIVVANTGPVTVTSPITSSGSGAITVSAAGGDSAMTVNANINGANSPLTLYATGDLEITSGVTVNNGTALATLGADVTSAGAGDNGTGALLIDGGAQVYGGTINLRGADENIASTATVGSAVTRGGDNTFFASGVNDAEGLAFDAAGNLYVANFGNSTISKVTPSGTVSIFASGGGLDDPKGLAVYQDELYVANAGNNTISVVDISTGNVTPLVQTGLDDPGGLAIDDASGSLYVANFGSDTVSVFSVISGVPVETITSDQFDEPDALAVDSSGNLYVANAANGTISEVTQPNGVPTVSQFVPFVADNPGALVFDTSGNLYVAGCNQFGSSTISEVTPSRGVSTVVPSGLGGLAFDAPDGLAFDGSGNLYVANAGDGTISKVAALTSVSTFASALNSPGALAIAPSGPVSGNVFVANAGDDTIAEFNSSGQPLATLSGFDGPDGLAFDGAGDLFVADSGDSAISKVTFDVNGVPTVSPNFIGGFDQPYGLAFDSAGNLFVANTGNGTISEVTFDVNGVPNNPALYLSGLGSPEGLAFDASGNLYVGNTTTAGDDLETTTKITPSRSITTFIDDTGAQGMAFDAAGNMYAAFNPPDRIGVNGIFEVNQSGALAPIHTSAFNGPDGIAIDESGNVYVANAGNGTIVKMTPSRVSTFVSGGLDYPDLFPADVASNGGNLFVANPVADTVSVVTSSGSVSTFVTSGLDGPDGLAFDANNNLYVANYNNNTISEVSPSGNVSTFVSSGLDGPEGLAFDANGNLYVANAGNNTVSEVSPFGSVSTLVSSGLDEPEGLAFDAFGNLYVQNAGNNTITEVAPLVAATTQLTIQSSVESDPMSIGGTNDAAVQGINLTNAELAALVTAPNGTITFGDSAQTGDISVTFGALPAALNVVGDAASMDVFATTGGDTVSKNSTQITWGSPASETINYSGIAQTTIHLGSGDDTVFDPGTNTTILGGPDHDTIYITASFGQGITVNSGTGSDDLIVSLGQIAAPVNFVQPSSASTNTLTVQAAPAATASIGVTSTQVTSGTQAINYPATIASVTVATGTASTSVNVDSTSAAGVTVQNEGGTTSTAVTLGNLAGPVNVTGSGTTSLAVSAPSGDNAIAVNAAGVQSGSQTVNVNTNVTTLAVDTGSGNNSVDVADLGNTVQNLAVNSGSGTTAVTVNNVGTSVSSVAVAGGSGSTTVTLNDVGASAPPIAVGGGTGTTQVQVVGTPPPQVDILTNTAVSSDHPSGSTYGQSVTFTANVFANVAGFGTPAGSVQFVVDGVAYGPAEALVNGAASVTLPALSAGPHSVVAQYTSDSVNVLNSASDPNYTFAVSPAPLTITANNQSKVYGATLPVLSASYTGLVNGDTAASLTTAPTLATTATQSSAVGSYPITVGGAVDGDYTISYVGGSLSVTPAALTVTATSASRLYLTPNPTLTDTISGFVNGDTPSVVNGAANLTTSATTASPAGTYPINVALGTLSAANYTFELVNGTFTVVSANSIFVLNSSAGGALTVSGNASINLPSGSQVIVDSKSATAIQASGNATLKATSTAVVGAYTSSGNASFSPKPTSGAAAVADPLAGLPAPSIAGLTSFGSLSLSGNTSKTINPGIYSQISVSGNAKLTMNAGTYIIEGGGFSVSGNAGVTGTGVMIFNAGSKYPATGGSYGSVTLSGNGTFNLTAPIAGQAYAGIMLDQPKDNTEALSISGNAVGSGATGGMSGTIYAPGALLSVSGNAQFKGSLDVGMLSLSGNSVADALTSSSATTYTPDQIRTAYGVNSLALDGTGQTIAIVEAYDDPSIFDSLDAFDEQFGVGQFGAAPSGPTLYQQYGPATSFLTVINQNGQASPLPPPDATGGWATEEALDVEWAHVLAPGAQIIVVEANSQALADLMAGVVTAANQPAVSVVSMSWGFQEGQAVLEQDEALYDGDFTTPAGHTPVTFVASTGDYGTADPEYPAFSPNVVAVGGTSLYLNGDGSYGGETGWGYESSSLGTFIGSGGGASLYEPEPTYQQGVQSTGNRTTPDVSLVADPETGVWIADTYNLPADSPWEVVGGTSLSAPSWAGLIALVDQGRVAAGEATLSSSSGIVTQQALYGLPQADFNSITSGTNGAYTAAAGYNLVTGLGTPVANLLVPDLIGYQAISPANQTAADLPASGGSGSGGSGDANVFNVFDVVTEGSGAPGDATPREPGLPVAEASLVTAPATRRADLGDIGAAAGFAIAVGAVPSSAADDTGAGSTDFDDVAGALAAALSDVHFGTVAKRAGLDEFWADFGDRAGEATDGQEWDFSL